MAALNRELEPGTTLGRSGALNAQPEIKRDSTLRRIPVVILTSSKAEENILQTYDLHANCYISKPVGFENFMTVVKSIDAFWLSVVKLPRG